MKTFVRSHNVFWLWFKDKTFHVKMPRCPYHSLFLYKTLSKSRIIKTFKMDRRKLQQRLRILILLQQMRRIATWSGKEETLGQRYFPKKRTSRYSQNIMHNDRELFFRYFRVSPKRFDHLLTLVREQIEKKNTAFR